MANRRLLTDLLPVSHEQIKSSGCFQPTTPSSIVIPPIIHDTSNNNLIVSSLVNEAKIYRDPCFTFLWRMQETMQPFADTGGQTTCLRSLERKHY